MVNNKYNIWLIDDDQAAHAYHTIMIRHAGLDVSRVRSFYDVDEPIRVLKEMNKALDCSRWPHYIFLDINMPLKSGYDFIQEFEEIFLQLRLPEIYFVSSTKNPEDIQRFEELDLVKGFETKFLERPFFENLIHKVSNEAE